MDAASALGRLGGSATLVELLDLTTRRRIRTAEAAGLLVRTRRGRYVLPDLDRAHRAAAQVGGVLALRSAALEHGWSVKWRPERPEIAIPRHRRRPASRGARLVWARELDVSTRATPALQTVVMCARALPFDEALAIADSALRTQAITPTELREAAERAQGPGSPSIRLVATHADGRAANAFESVLRAHCLDAGLEMTPQLPVPLGDRIVHPDLTEERRRLVVEADSWEFHTGKQAHERDCWRYNALTLAGYLVLRFAWEQVMLDPDYVVECLRSVADRPLARAEVAPRRRRVG